MAINGYTVVKTFAATKERERGELGERVTEWIKSASKLEVVDTIVSLSSDQAYHCLVITVFARQRGAGQADGAGL